MKVKDEIIIAAVDDNYMLVDSDTSDKKFNGMIKLNESAKDIIEILQKDISYEDLLNAYVAKYEIDKELAIKDIDRVIQKLEEANILIK